MGGGLSLSAIMVSCVSGYSIIDHMTVMVVTIAIIILIGASLSEPHINGTAVR